MDTTEVITPPPSEDQPTTRRSMFGRLRDRPLRVHRSTWMLLLAVAMTVAAMLIAAEAGALMGAFGLAWGALGLAVVLVLAGILVRRQAMLPLSLVATALTLPAAALTLSQPPLDRSAGPLIVRPATLSQIDGKTFRRGAGSILIDLRALKVTDNARLTVHAHSDLGRVVVALPNDRCFNISVRAKRLPDMRVPLQLALAAIGKDHLRRRATEDAYSSPTEFRAEESYGDVAMALRAFGRSADNRNVYPPVATFTRPVAGHAPSLDLTLSGAVASFVRDYPDQVNPLSGDNIWPLNEAMPPQPGQLRSADRWRQRWTKRQIATGVPAKWAAWEKTAIVQQAARARKAAGACATNDVLADYWSTSRFGRFVLAVNGVGRIKRLAWRSDGSIAPTTMAAANLEGAR